MSQRRQYEIRKALKRKEKDNLPWAAIMGDGAGTIEVPGYPTLRYVRAKGSDIPLIVHRGGAPDAEGQPVWVGYDDLNRVVRILGERFTDGTSTPGGGGIVAHADSHFATGSDPVYIDSRQIVPHLAWATLLSIRVNGGWAIVAGQPVHTTTQNVDMTSHVPVSGALYALIRVSDAGALDVQEGTPVDSLADLSYADIPEIAEGYAAIWAVRLYAAQTAISNSITSPDLVDLRFATQSPGGGIPDAADVTYTPTVATDWNSDTDPGDVDGALDQLAERVDDLEAGAGHDAVTLAADADTILSLSTQEIGLDTQTANYVLAGPTTGAAADPTFRALVAADVGTGAPDGTKFLKDDMSWAVPAGVGNIVFGWTGGNTIINPPQYIDISLPEAGVLTGWRILAETATTVSIDVWKDTYANYPPTVADSICHSSFITLAGAVKNEDTSITAWDKTITAGDTMRLALTDNTLATRIIVVMTYTRS